MIKREKNDASEGSESPKIEKTSFPRSRINPKDEKQRFRLLGKSKSIFIHIKNTIMKLKTIALTSLQNMEHYQFASRVLQLCNEAKVGKLTAV